MNISFQLSQLQHIDTQIDQDKKRIDDIIQELKNNESVNQVKASIIKIEAENKSIHNEFIALNDEIQSKKNKLSQSESSLYGGTINNPKELQDLQSEISSLNRSISQLEDTLMDILIRQEAVEEKHQSLQDELKSVLSDFETQKSLLTGEKLKLEENIGNYQSKRDAVLSQLDEDSKKIYHSLRTLKNGLAVASLNEDSCSACGTFLTASQCQEVRSPNKMFFCPSCGRIIHG